MPRIPRALLGASVLAVMLAPAGASGRSTTHIYSGPGSSCGDTLQLCIDNAFTNDSIEIHTEERIDENLEINKSLTLRAGAGMEPLIGGTHSDTDRRELLLTPDESGTTMNVLLDGLNFEHA